MKSRYEGWDQIYRRYPLEKLAWELGEPRPILVELVQTGRITKGKALDLCCGAGTNTVYLAQNGFQVIGIDISPKAIEHAKKKAEQEDVEIEFTVENFVDLSFQDEKFDFVYDMGCFHHVHIEDRNTFIKEVHRVLKSKGTYSLTCFSYKNGAAWNHFTKSRLIDFFSGYFDLQDGRHYGSVEGDGFKRYFYSLLMRKKK